MTGRAQSAIDFSPGPGYDNGTNQNLTFHCNPRIGNAEADQGGQRVKTRADHQTEINSDRWLACCVHRLAGVVAWPGWAGCLGGGAKEVTLHAD